ncbi:hypothetical protein [Allohahella marinimesophila]|uniref:Transposase n=1 Tax=Allohahella marinimesophila TaxID=1054972 RepID=A0ABP7P620_9GAMM
MSERLHPVVHLQAIEPSITDSRGGLGLLNEGLENPPKIEPRNRLTDRVFKALPMVTTEADYEQLLSWNVELAPASA